MLDNKDGIRRGPFGSALKKEYFIKDGPYVVFEQQNAIYERFNTRYRITEEKYQELIKFSISPGDFIMSGAGTIGKIARVPVGVESGVFNQALIRFRLNKKLVSPDYFLQLMRSEPMQKRLTSANPGSAITNLVPMSELKKWNIRVPDLVEQKHIAKLLSTIDIAIASNQRKLDSLKSVKKALMQKIFDQTWRFEGFNDPWEQRKLGQIVKITMGQSPDSTNYTKDSNDYILVQGNSDMENGKVRPRVWTTQVTKTADRGDLILSVRAPVGDVGKTDYDVVLGRGVASIKGNEYIFQYLRMLNINGYWAKFITGSTFESINSKDINNAQVRYPVVQEQNKIGTLLEKADQAIASNQFKIDKLKEIKKWLMQSMFV